MNPFKWGGYTPKESESVCKTNLECQTSEMADVNKKAQAEFYAYEQAEELEREKLRTYDAGISVRKFQAGDFICIGKHEIPRKFIQDIKVTSVGSPPYLRLRTPEYDEYMAKHRAETSSYYMGNYKDHAQCYDAIANNGSAASVQITMASGATILLECHRLAVDMFFDALNTAWKHAKAI